VAKGLETLTGVTMHLMPNLYVRPSTLFMKSLADERFYDTDPKGRALMVVEIGTDKGFNAMTILRNLNVKKMYLIDPYLEEGFQGSSRAEYIAKRRLKKYSDKIVWVKKKSEDALNDVPDGIDFLYIDGLHTKEQVAMELDLYYPKMKTGGIIAGHDYIGMHIPLTEAVVEFAQKRLLKLQGGSLDFWMEKGDWYDEERER